MGLLCYYTFTFDNVVNAQIIINDENIYAGT